MTLKGKIEKVLIGDPYADEFCIDKLEQICIREQITMLEEVMQMLTWQTPTKSIKEVSNVVKSLKSQLK
jgi:hypothetical protein